MKLTAETVEIDVKLNDRVLKGNVRKNSGIPSRMFFFIWENKLNESSSTKIAMLTIKKNGKYYFKYSRDYLVPMEEIALLYKLYRYAEKHMEIL